MDVCEDKFECKNPRHKPKFLATPHLTIIEHTVLLTKQNLSLTENG